MKFLEFQKKTRAYPLFSVHDLQIIFPQENIHTINKQISTWTKQKKIERLKNGLYALPPEYSADTLTPEVIAAKLYEPSYISLEYAMSTYGMIPEAVFGITSVTTRCTQTFQTPFGAYSYRTIKPACFFGFKTLKHGKLPFYMAFPEKALVDFLYLNSSRFAPEFAAWKGLRLQNLDEINFKSLNAFAEKFRSKKLLALTNNIKLYAASS